jgi:heat-inducible transcriptional repressor
MEKDRLSKREYLVLEALIRAYVATEAPVGSATLSHCADLGISPATIRSALARLEEKGFVCQPHTSAGRMPTDMGYRAYVEHGIAAGSFIPGEDSLRLRRQLEAKLQEGRVDEILGQLAKIIGDISSQLGLVMAPRFEQGVFHKVELVRLSEHRLLLVVTIDQGPVKSLVVEVDSGVSQRDLEAVSRLINERLQGLTMAEIRGSVHERLRVLEGGNPQLLRVVVEEIAGLGVSRGTDLHIAGTRNIFLQPEFRDPRQAAGLMDLVERKEELAHLLTGREGVVITIGEENQVQEMRLCSMVTASYEVKGAVGIIGVIGPTRMPYGRVLALVHCAASRAAELVS